MMFEWKLWFFLCCGIIMLLMSVILNLCFDFISFVFEVDRSFILGVYGFVEIFRVYVVIVKCLLFIIVFDKELCCDDRDNCVN